MKTEAPRLTRRDVLIAAAAGAAAAMSPYAYAARSQNERLERFFEDVFRRRLARDPLLRASLGDASARCEWPDLSEARQVEEHERVRRDLAALRRFDYDALTPDLQLSYRLLEYQLERSLKAFEWRLHRYPLSQMRGLQRTIPQTLINDHPIVTRDDAEAYITRLHGVRRLLAQQVDQLERARVAGIQPPRFVYPLVIGTCENLLRGAPFDASGTDSPIFADFRTKLAATNLSPAMKTRLTERAVQGLREGFEPGFRQLIDWLRKAEASSTDEAGVWKLPEGGTFYAHMLEAETTLPLTAGEVHETGLREVERIHGEMRALMRHVGFDGSLQEFFAFLRTDPRFYYPDDDEGRAQYLAAAQAILDGINARLPELLTRRPRASMIIKRVEPWLEKSAGTAGYFGAPADGSRPGILYFNMRTMANLPKYELQALTYHEGVPGHHVQVSISRELTGIPEFRRHSGYTAYSEGWALYAEELPKGLGLYQDPYQDFGRLSMELMRAARLVVDSGLHALRWTREQAIEYLDRHTPSSHADNVTSVGRYIVLPGQATAYMTGKLKLLELRSEAQRTLGGRFDLRGFHDAILGEGNIPLPFLESLVQDWIRSRKDS